MSEIPNIITGAHNTIHTNIVYAVCILHGVLLLLRLYVTPTQAKEKIRFKVSHTVAIYVKHVICDVFV